MKSEKVKAKLRRARDLATRLRLRNDPVAYARTLGVTIGEGSQIIAFKRSVFGTEPFLITIGNHVSIAQGVTFITHDGSAWVYREKHPGIDAFGPITVGNNVLIGQNAIILPGVTIGDNCIIGAGSLVTKDVPSGYIATGMPARAIKTIDEYWETLKDKTIVTKGMPYDQKRRLLEEKYMGRHGKD